MSDLVLRITSKQKKTSHILDFNQEIDYLSPENKFTLIDGKIIANLKKKNANEEWEKLVHKRNIQRRIEIDEKNRGIA